MARPMLRPEPKITADQPSNTDEAPAPLPDDAMKTPPASQADTRKGAHAIRLPFALIMSLYSRVTRTNQDPIVH